jgi:putative nucleotidyltransferase with HDIG domain
METGTSDLSRVLAQKLSGGGIELPPMPATAAEVMALCQDDATDAARLSAVIHRDQTIASNVLRVANSAAYGAEVQVASLQQAVSRLGMQLITEVALAVSVRGRMFTNRTCADLLPALWKHSVLVGFYSKEIARMLRRNVEVAFLCGLLHDIGKAVLLNDVDRSFDHDGIDTQLPELLAAVHEQHGPAGVMLAREWKLADQIAVAIACHHDPSAARRHADMAMTVQLADQIAYHIAPSRLAKKPSEEQLRCQPVLVGLNVYPDQLQALLDMRERAFAVTEGLS